MIDLDALKPGDRLRICRDGPFKGDVVVFRAVETRVLVELFPGAGAAYRAADLERADGPDPVESPAVAFDDERERAELGGRAVAGDVGRAPAGVQRALHVEPHAAPDAAAQGALAAAADEVFRGVAEEHRAIDHFKGFVFIVRLWDDLKARLAALRHRRNLPALRGRAGASAESGPKSNPEARP